MITHKYIKDSHQRIVFYQSKEGDILSSSVIPVAQSARKND